ncbi:MAG: phosphodiesterase, family [Clostridia bacterium]|jgi:putative phosphoesterase|nr:phosphodiesterase, family [Clostridia bacterium]
MKVLVISDTHRNISNAVKIIELIKCMGLKAIIHCGDHIDDAKRLKSLYKDIEMYSVYGNCDGMAYGKLGEQVIQIEGVSIFITHGHRHGVKWGEYEELLIDAAAYGAKLAICGHSHCAYLEKKQGIILLNPGSISLPRDFRYPSYGILDVENGFIKDVSIMQIGDNGVVLTHPASTVYRNK